MKINSAGPVTTGHLLLAQRWKVTMKRVSSQKGDVVCKLWGDAGFRL